MPFIVGVERGQVSMLPDRIEDFVGPDDIVRVIDAFIAGRNLRKLGFTTAVCARRGRPCYEAATIVGIHVFGYLQGITSSRLLERACQRDLHMMWLTGKLAPDHKTIAEFRRLNKEPIAALAADFIVFCRAHGLVGKPGRLPTTPAGEPAPEPKPTVAVDGSKIAAVASRDRVLSRNNLIKAKARTEKALAEARAYLAGLDASDTADAALPLEGRGEALRVRAVLAVLERRAQRIETGFVTLALAGRDTLVEGEGEAVVVGFRGGGKGPGYNLQTAVDDQSGLIVHHGVVAESCDRKQLVPMAEAARAVLGGEELRVLADTGYSSGEAAAACEAAGIEVVAPAQRTVNPSGLFGAEKFAHDASTDTLTCPAGETLERRSAEPSREGRITYQAESCPTCPLKAACTTGKHRTVSRLTPEREGALARMNARAGRDRGFMRRRMALAERPFARVKRMLGARFRLRGLKKVAIEATLAILAYNIDHLARRIGHATLRAALAHP